MSPSSESDPSADHELVKRAIGGSPEAIASLSKRLESLPRLIAAANRRLSTPLAPQELADVAQDAFLAIWQKLETYGGRGTLEGWAWTYGFNFLRNRVRSVALHRQRSSPSVEPIELIAARTTDPMPIDPEDLSVALNDLPPEMAEVIRLKHDEGLMFKDIATRLGIAPGTVKTRYYRGVMRIREQLTTGRSPITGQAGGHP